MFIVLFLYPVYPQKINIAILQLDAANITEAEVHKLTVRLSYEPINFNQSTDVAVGARTFKWS